MITPGPQDGKNFPGKEKSRLSTKEKEKKEFESHEKGSGFQ